jgi:hypothetical protein
MRLRLNNKDTRQMLIAELNKKEKSLDTKYNNKIYTQEELNKIAKKGK